ncbi:right-handed parallel beta-helix repeat-containing protein [Pseudonocardia zijingensis]|uniref:right-handed parallel beta-helix repeat-containing protein n=1 Tax=Pseudonocardia zijingensis TaxID=153376 RepID=UPI0031D03A15
MSSVRPFLITAAAVLAFVVTGCSAPPEPLPRREVPEHGAVDPARPCSREPGTAPATGTAPDGGEPQARFDAATNTIVLTGGEDVPLPALGEEVADSALREVEPGVWFLGANIAVQPGASLRVAAPDVHWLRMAGGGGAFVSITAYGGGLAVEGTCITSWDPGTQTVDEDHEDRRSYLLARDGATMTIDDAELRFLGSGDVESYGLSWRTEGTTGHIRGSVISHLYYGLYSYEVDGLEVTDNEFHDNVLYGVDPHTESRNLVIERNVVHHNGKHGIILAEDCVDSVIRDNVVYANKHHGIVMYQNSDRNLIEGNESFGNAAQGININESHENEIRANKVYDNAESGVGITQTSRSNVVADNQLRGNGKDGIRLVSEAAETTVRGNTIGRNERYGVYVDTVSGFELTGNTVFGSRVGLMIKGGDEADEGDNEVFGNEEADALSS